mmetsp:Transcript_52152/g.86298  ORF Transcript_52152/g.86298 Transcript_52152/m.86298 type:complete len:227 (-) Transcript_52152:414-1094(-)
MASISCKPTRPKLQPITRLHLLPSIHQHRQPVRLLCHQPLLLPIFLRDHQPIFQLQHHPIVRRWNQLSIQLCSLPIFHRYHRRLNQRWSRRVHRCLSVTPMRQLPTRHCFPPKLQPVCPLCCLRTPLRKRLPQRRLPNNRALHQPICQLNHPPMIRPWHRPLPNRLQRQPVNPQMSHRNRQPKLPQLSPRRTLKNRHLDRQWSLVFRLLWSRLSRPLSQNHQTHRK